MKTKYPSSPFIAVTIVAFTLLVALGIPSQTDAAIAKIAKVSGDVIIQSGEELRQVASPGAPLNDGDRVQTRQGEAEILFNDGAIMRINPFSNAMLQEREERGGFWIFKTSSVARRITCLVGKLFFQSGSSGTKNYLQTPTAVAGIRGSSGDIGFDNLSSYLNMYTGDAAVLGTVIRGFFQNPGVSVAEKSAVYQSLVRAAEVKQSAEVTGRTVNIAQAQIAAAEVGRQVAEALQKNPDATVQMDGKLIGQQTSAVIAVVTARVAVEQIKEEKASADKAAVDASQKGETEKARQAGQASQKAEQDRIAAEQSVAAAKAAADQTMAAAKQRDLDNTTKAAENATKAAQEATRIEQETRRTVQNVVTTTVPMTAPTTTPATTVAPTTISETTIPATTAPATTVAPTTVGETTVTATTVPATTAPTTILTTTTTSTTTSTTTVPTTIPTTSTTTVPTTSTSSITSTSTSITSTSTSTTSVTPSR
jgi:hypothetical protein